MLKNLQVLTVFFDVTDIFDIVKLFCVFLKYFYVNHLRIGNPQYVREWICLSIRGSSATIVYSLFSQLGKSSWLVITLRCTDLYRSFKMQGHIDTRI